MRGRAAGGRPRAASAACWAHTARRAAARRLMRGLAGRVCTTGSGSEGQLGTEASPGGAQAAGRGRHGAAWGQQLVLRRVRVAGSCASRAFGCAGLSGSSSGCHAQLQQLSGSSAAHQFPHACSPICAAAGTAHRPLSPPSTHAPPHSHTTPLAVRPSTQTTHLLPPHVCAWQLPTTRQARSARPGRANTRSTAAPT